jgi:hypothetical protein
MRAKLLATVLGMLAVFAGPLTLSARRASPTVLMIHGGGLNAPVFVVQRSIDDVRKYLTLWCGGSQKLEADQLTARPFYTVSAFWGLYPLPDEAGTASLLRTLHAEQAHQQIRLYASSGGVRAAAVSTEYMEFDRNSAVGAMLTRPVPTDATSFKYGAWLSEVEIAAVETLGVRLRR